MKTALTLQERLKDLRVGHGLTLEQLSEQTGISKSALGNYENDDKDISHYSIAALAKYYGVSTDYLLGLSDTKESQNAQIDDLHLGDELIHLLKHEKINCRLLSEIAAHDDFVKLMADIEIYVDGIASMQVQNLNALVDIARDKIVEQYQPNEDDSIMRVLDAAHVDEDEYFMYIVRDDLGCIIRDIRAAHMADRDSASNINPLIEWKTIIEETEKLQCSPKEKQAVLFCKQLGIDYTKLTEEEFQIMVRVLEKSKHLKTHLKQRGKKRKQ